MDRHYPVNSLSTLADAGAASPPGINDHGIWRGAIALAAVTLLGFGLAYSLLATGLAGTAFPQQATGSLLRDGDGRVIGSLLIAQPFGDARYFQPRPSASGYDPMAAAGSNQARSNPALARRIEDTRAAVAARDGIAPEQVPSELLTQSGSGLDPDLSPQAAALQVPRVAAARGLSQARVAQLLREHVQPRQFGLFGQPRVNVLALNLALDGLQ